MTTSPIRRQRGQAMSEFIVAMALFLPLILGTIYIAKYSDIKHQAIQASRYAAFEQALDPSAQHESANGAAVLKEETRERFFTNSATIGFKDTTAGLSTAATLNRNWSEVDGTTPMVTNYADIAVNFTQGQINSIPLQATDQTANALYKLNGGGQVQANVQVNAANIASFAPLSNLNLQIGASTVVASDTWNGDGAADVGGHFTPASLASTLLKEALQPFNAFSDGLFQLFSGTNGPQWGCVDADAVPKDHLSTYNAPAPCSN
jgi:hypothetical protein